MTNDRYDWLNNLPAPEKAEAPEPKERTMPSGPKALQLPDAVTEKIKSGEWFAQPGLPDGKSATAFLYAVRVAAKKYVTEDAPNGHGLQVFVDKPENALLKNLRTLEGPITLRISAANPLDTRRGNRKGKSTAEFFADLDIKKAVLTEAELELEDENDDEGWVSPAVAHVADDKPKTSSPGAFVDPDEVEAEEWENSKSV